MEDNKRRAFVKTTLMAGLTVGLTDLALATGSESVKISHHVFFWLINPDSAEDLKKVIEGVKSLGKIPQVKNLQVGVPAKTPKRDVVDNSWAVSELMYFDSVEDHGKYQTHAIHKAFVDSCSPLLEKVVVYDAVTTN